MNYRRQDFQCQKCKLLETKDFHHKNILCLEILEPLFTYNWGKYTQEDSLFLSTIPLELRYHIRGDYSKIKEAGNATRLSYMQNNNQEFTVVSAIESLESLNYHRMKAGIQVFFNKYYGET